MPCHTTRRWTLALLALACLACADGRDLSRQTAEADALVRAGSWGVGAGDQEGVSLLGEPLLRLPTDPAIEAALDSALAAYEANPADADALVWVGRRYAYTGRYRAAIEAFSEGIRRFPGDARFYRHRGHRYITVRELDRAIEDLEHAARLTSGQRDAVEPDGMPNPAGIPRSTLQTNIWYHLALARYLAGDFEGAAYGFRHGLEISPNDDMRVAMADWLWMALRRLDRPEDAERAIEFVRLDMEILENHAYHRRLLLYRGLLPPDSLAPAVAADGAVDRDLTLATYGYGLGHWHLVSGDRARARRIFEDVLETGYWPAFGYIAAEAELAR